MAVQIVKPVDTGFPMNPSTVESRYRNGRRFHVGIPELLRICVHYHTHIDDDSEEDIDV